MIAQVNGIQQLGVGVENVEEAWKWYREHFSMDIRMFEDVATAELMLIIIALIKYHNRSLDF